MEHERITLGQLTVDFKVTAMDSNGTVTMFECGVPAGSRMPMPHSHDAFEETAYTVEGVCTWTVDGETHEVGPGEHICIRRGQIHGFENRGTDHLRFLAIATPGVFGKPYFEDLQDALSAGGPPDPAVMAGIMRRHGLTPAPPVAA